MPTNISVRDPIGSLVQSTVTSDSVSEADSEARWLKELCDVIDPRSSNVCDLRTLADLGKRLTTVPTATRRSRLLGNQGRRTTVEPSLGSRTGMSFAQPQEAYLAMFTTPALVL